jgi:hypothetical protein
MYMYPVYDTKCFKLLEIQQNATGTKLTSSMCRSLVALLSNMLLNNYIILVNSVISLYEAPI